MKRAQLLRIIVSFLLALSLASNVWLGTRFRAYQKASDYAFEFSMHQFTLAMNSAFGSLSASPNWDERSWLGTFQMVEVARNHAQTAANLKPFLTDEQLAVAEKLGDLSFDLLGFNYIVGQLQTGENRENARLAVQNWVDIYEQTAWPTTFSGTNEEWVRLNVSLERFRKATAELQHRCMSMPAKAGINVDPITLRYGCERWSRKS